MYHFEKKNSKIFFPEGPRENVWGPRENVFPGPDVALDGPVPLAAVALLRHSATRAEKNI